MKGNALDVNQSHPTRHWRLLIIGTSNKMWHVFDRLFEYRLIGPKGRLYNSLKAEGSTCITFNNKASVSIMLFVLYTITMLYMVTENLLVLIFTLYQWIHSLIVHTMTHYVKVLSQ